MTTLPTIPPMPPVLTGLARPRRLLTPDEERWLTCAAHMAAAGKAAALPLYGTALGRTVLGQGAGGDRTLEIDRACEAAIFDVLAREAPAPYRSVSEEAGIAGPPEAAWRVVIDPLDGSLNAKRGLEPFGASIAVAAGPTLGDVDLGYIEDYTRPRAFAAVKGAGLVLAGPPAGTAGGGAAPLPAAGRSGPPDTATADPPAEPRPLDDDLIEIVLLEAGRPDRHRFRYHDLCLAETSGRSRDMRIRQIGSLALSLCYVAVGVADVLIAAVKSRAVDLAAGLLILREAGGGVATLAGPDIWAQPLDLEKRSAFVAWRAGIDQAEIAARAQPLGRTLLAQM